MYIRPCPISITPLLNKLLRNREINDEINNFCRFLFFIKSAIVISFRQGGMARHSTGILKNNFIFRFLFLRRKERKREREKNPTRTYSLVFSKSQILSNSGDDRDDIESSTVTFSPRRHVIISSWKVIRKEQLWRKTKGGEEGPRQYGLCRSRFIEAEHRCISDGRARKRDEGNEAREENRRGCWRRGGGGIYQPLQLLNSSPFLKKVSLSRPVLRINRDRGTIDLWISSWII